MLILRVTLFGIAKRQKWPKCLWTDEWINKMWYIIQHIIQPEKEISSHICYNIVEIWKHYANWNKPEYIILTEISQKWFHFCEVLAIVQFIETESIKVAAPAGEGWRDGKLLFNRYKDSKWDDKNILEIQIVMMVANNVNALNATEMYT